MSQENVQFFLKKFAKIDPQSAADVDIFFAELKTSDMPAAGRDAVVQQIEATVGGRFPFAPSVLEEMRETIDLFEMAFKTPTTKAFMENVMKTQVRGYEQMVPCAQMLVRVFENISALRGEDSMRVTKIVLDEASKISEKDHAETLPWIKALLSISERVDVAQKFQIKPRKPPERTDGWQF